MHFECLSYVTQNVTVLLGGAARKDDWGISRVAASLGMVFRMGHRLESSVMQVTVGAGRRESVQGNPCRMAWPLSSGLRDRLNPASGGFSSGQTRLGEEDFCGSWRMEHGRFSGETNRAHNSLDHVVIDNPERSE